MLVIRLLLLLLLYVISNTAHSKDEVKVATPIKLIETFNKLTTTDNFHQLDLDLVTKAESRGFAELKIICLAIHRTNSRLSIKLFPSPGYKSGLRMVEDGAADFSAETI